MRISQSIKRSQSFLANVNQVRMAKCDWQKPIQLLLKGCGKVLYSSIETHHKLL